MTTTRIDKHGNTIVSRVVDPSRERYAYDTLLCPSAAGWRQYDTDQDAPYFGIWVHEQRREIVNFVEGEEVRISCPTVESFRAELARMASFYGPPPPAFTVVGSDGVRIEIYDPRPTGDDPS